MHVLARMQPGEADECRQITVELAVAAATDYVLVPALARAGQESSFWLSAACGDSASAARCLSLEVLVTPTGPSWRQAVDSGLMAKKTLATPRALPPRTPQLRMPATAELQRALCRDGAELGSLSLEEVDSALAQLFPAVNCKPALTRAFRALADSGEGVELREGDFGRLLEYPLSPFTVVFQTSQTQPGVTIRRRFF